MLTDQSMPGMNGIQLSNAIKASVPGTPVVLLTGFGDELLNHATSENPLDVDLVLCKPVSQADLRRAIYQATEKVHLLASVA